MAATKLKDFKVLETTYKVFLGQNINLSVLIPKIDMETPHPVIVKFHGGFLVTGAALFADWYADWLVEYTLLHKAIIVAPNHRLLPESKGVDIIEDLNDFWFWFANSLQPYLETSAPGTKVDLSKVLVVGESAGGYLSVQSSLSNPFGLVKAVVAPYPVLDLKSPHFTKEYEKIIRGQKTVPKSVLERHLQTMKRGKIVTSATPPERMPLALSLVQQGLYAKMLGDETILYPLERINEVRDIPFTLILHGEQDSAVPVQGSTVWFEKAVEAFGADKVALVVQPGEHGFEITNVSVQTPWLAEQLARVTTEWLGKDVKD